MLPGLVLTVGLIAQSIGTLITPAFRNPDAPRFVNIGDDIIQSSTAKPIAPAGVCAPAPEASAALPPQRVIVEVHVTDDQSDLQPTEMAEGVSPDQAAGQIYGGVAFVPIVARRPHRGFGRTAPFASHSQFRSTAGPTARTVMLPPFQTVLLPPQPTVLLPPGMTPQPQRVR